MEGSTRRFTETFSRRFVPAVLIGTPLVIIMLLLGSGWTWEAAFYRGMLLSVAASPCALAIGTPAAVLAGKARWRQIHLRRTPTWALPGKSPTAIRSDQGRVAPHCRTSVSMERSQAVGDTRKEDQPISPKLADQAIKPMKTINSKTPFIRSSIALAAIIAVWIPSSSWSAEPVEGKEMKMEGKMMETCEEMKKEKKKMQAEMKAQDAELTTVVATMNSAAQEKKIELMAGVVTRLVEQRAAMHDKKAKMEEKMMKHMMAHMEKGKESMSKCPMMKDIDGKSDDAQAEHHEKPE